MTALDHYDRLEALGLWRDASGDSGREVVVKFGNATLVVLTGDDKPITHWSLSAIRSIHADDDRTIYAVDGDDATTLAITDTQMRAALDKVISAAKTSQPVRSPRGGRVRLWSWLLLVCALGALVFVTPMMMRNYAHRLISPQRSQVLATEMLPMIEDRTGPACETPKGNAALARLHRVVAPGAEGGLHVLDSGDVPVIALPGGHVVLNSALVRDARSVDELAGWAAVGVAGSANSPGLRGLFDKGGTWDGIKFILTGDLPKRAMNRSINRLLIRPEVLSRDVETEVARILTAANIRPDPLIIALRREGLATALAPWTPNAPNLDILSDEEWVALQEICEG